MFHKKEPQLENDLVRGSAYQGLESLTSMQLKKEAVPIQRVASGKTNTEELQSDKDEHSRNNVESNLMASYTNVPPDDDGSNGQLSIQGKFQAPNPLSFSIPKTVQRSEKAPPLQFETNPIQKSGPDVVGNQPSSTVAAYMAGEMSRNVVSGNVRRIRNLLNSTDESSIPFYNPTPGVNQARAYMEFAQLVRTGGVWDHKPYIESHFGRYSDDIPSNSSYFYDIWSNIHYGYIGLACGFGETELLQAPGGQQIVDIIRRQDFGRISEGLERGMSEGLAGFDDPLDQSAIRLGFIIYRSARGSVTPELLMSYIRALRPMLSHEPLHSTSQGHTPSTTPTAQPKLSSENQIVQKENPIQTKSSSLNTLPQPVQNQMENALGADFSDVKIHTNSSSATEVGALAYTQGTDVHFAPGQYNPESSSGQELIGHELTHVVQQREGRVQPTTQAAGLPVNDDKGLESEADEGGRKVVQGKFEREGNLINKNNHQDARVTLQKLESGTPLKNSNILNSNPLRVSTDGTLQINSTVQPKMNPKVSNPINKLIQRQDDSNNRRERNHTRITISDRPTDDILLNRWQQLINLGFQDGNIGNLSNITQNDFDTGYNILYSLIVTHRRTEGNGLLRGWNHYQDGLGAQSEGHSGRLYRNPIEYALNLQHLSTASGASNYEDFRRHIAVELRLAGAPVRVHPRNIYFVSAAQIGMDEAASMNSGQHYFAPATGPRLINEQLRYLNNISNSINIHSNIIRRSLSRRRPNINTNRQIERSRRIIESTIPQVEEIVQALNLIAIGIQNNWQTNHDRRESAQQETEFDTWLQQETEFNSIDRQIQDSRINILSNITTPNNVENICNFVSSLQGLISGRPASRHGTGAMDLHGTEHAMGFAIDFGTATDNNTENRGIPDNYMIFVNYIIDNGNSSVIPAGTRAHSIAAFTHEQRWAISQLIMSNGVSLKAQLDERRIEQGRLRQSTEPPSREVLQQRRSGRIQDIEQSRNLLNILRRIRVTTNQLRSARQYNLTVKNAASRVYNYVVEILRSSFSRGVSNIPPNMWNRIFNQIIELIIDFNTILDEYKQELQSQISTLASNRTTERLIRNRHQNIARVEDIQINLHQEQQNIVDLSPTLSEWAVQAQTRFEQRQFQELIDLYIEDGQFRRWISNAIEHGIYSQPDIYVHGLESVHSFSDGTVQFQGGHHWDIAPMGIQGSSESNIITDDGAYRAALQNDMSRRTVENLERIVNYIFSMSTRSHQMTIDPILQEQLVAHGISSERLNP